MIKLNTLRVSLPSPLLVLFTDRSKVSLDKLNFTPSFLSNETDATLSTAVSYTHLRAHETG